jgi:hypothetical protein
MEDGVNQQDDWLPAIDDLLTERGVRDRCLLCGHRPVEWVDILPMASIGVSYTLCNNCRRADPEAERVRLVLTARYNDAATFERRV